MVQPNRFYVPLQLPFKYAFHIAVAPFVSIALEAKERKSKSDKQNVVIIPQELVGYAHLMRVPYSVDSNYPYGEPEPAAETNIVGIGLNGSVKATACAIKLHEMGLVPKPLHLAQPVRKQHLTEAAIKVAEILGMEMDVIQCSAAYARRNGWLTETQMVTGHIIARALYSGLRPRVCLGNVPTNCVQVSDHDYEWSSTVEVMAEADSYFKRVDPRYERISPISSYTEAFETVVSYDPALLDACSNCKTLKTSHGLHRRLVKQNFNYVPVPGRCGQCRGCTIEYLHRVAYKLEKPNVMYLAARIQSLVIRSAKYYGYLQPKLMPVIWHISQFMPADKAQEVYSIAHRSM